MTATTDTSNPRTGSTALAWGLSTAAAMWAVGYVLYLPFVRAPVLILLVTLLACLFISGWLWGRCTGGTWRDSALAGLACALPNLLMLGAVIADMREVNPQRAVLLGAQWAVGSVAVSVGLMLLGAALGKNRNRNARPIITGPFLLSIATAAAAGLLVLSGGLVTGHDAGLAVPDWPGSFTHNMFLLPLNRMVGGVYYEHSHRLVGTLVGLMSIVLLVQLFQHRAPRWLKHLSIAVLTAVIVQGVLGGLRVIMAKVDPAAQQVIEISTPEDETALSEALRVIHGVVGQLILAALAGIATAMSAMWRSALSPRSAASASLERKLGVILIVALIVQLILGALQRHAQALLLTHISFAVVVLALALAAGLRAWGIYGQEIPTLRRTGLWLTASSVLQVLLGLAALAVISNESVSLVLNAIITTVHQFVGALMLILAVVQTMWCYRLLTPAEEAPIEGVPRTAQ